jgi:hypothetical protein
LLREAHENMREAHGNLRRAARGRKADRTHRRRPQASLKFRKELEEALKDSLRRWWDRNQELPEKVAPMST